MVIVRRMCRGSSGIGYLFYSRYKIIRGCLVEIVKVFVTVRGFSFAANLNEKENHQEVY